MKQSNSSDTPKETTAMNGLRRGATVMVTHRAGARDFHGKVTSVRIPPVRCMYLGKSHRQHGMTEHEDLGELEYPGQAEKYFYQTGRVTVYMCQPIVDTKTGPQYRKPIAATELEVIHE